MSTIHLILQGKGGVGKSFLAAMLAQYLMSRETSVFCVDADPENPTFASYKSLHVNKIKLIKDDDIDREMFDKLVLMIADEKGQDVILDSGASSFVALSAYMIQNDTVSALANNGFKVIIHTVVAGGQEFEETLKGVWRLAKKFPDDAELFLWKNEYKGECGVIKPGDDERTPLEKLTLFTDIQSRIMAMVHLKKQPELFEKDIRQMVSLGMTFDDVDKSPDVKNFNFITKNRIFKFKREVFGQLDVAFGFVDSGGEETEEDE